MDQYNALEGRKPVNISDTERIISAIAGGWLVMRMLKKRNLGLINGAAAAFLLYRGLKGHCPARAAIDKAAAEVNEGSESAYLTDPIEDPAIVNKVVVP